MFICTPYFLKFKKLPFLKKYINTCFMSHDCLAYINYKDSYKKLQLQYILQTQTLYLENCGILFSFMKAFSQYLYFESSWSKEDNNNYFLRFPCGLNVLRHVKYLEWWLSPTEKRIGEMLVSECYYCHA